MTSVPDARGSFAPTLAALAAIAVLCVGVVLGTHVAGGSDSSCYLNTAKLLSRGAVRIVSPLAQVAPWGNAALTFTPTGFTPSSGAPAALVPICAPGLPLVMAGFRALGLGESLVVATLGALAVWLTYVFGRQIDRPLTGALAAVLLASSPTFLYQAVQPMSDVPATAWWLLALVFAVERPDGSTRPTFAGLAASMAVMTRPNLAPLCAVVGGYLFLVGGSRQGVKPILKFGVSLVPGLLVLGLLQRAMYGSPVSTGYGVVSDLMSTTNVPPNFRRYLGWLLSVHSPFLLLALASPVTLRRRHALLGFAFIVTTSLCYLPYRVFDDWWYTRFLLPAIPVIIVMSVATLVAAVEWLGRSVKSSVRLTALAAVTVVLMALWLRIARERHAFDLSEWEQHYYRAGTAVAANVSKPAVIVTLRNSGSVQYYAGRPTMSWDTLGPGSLDQALTFVRGQGYEPYLLFEIDEEPVFRERFHAASAIGQLDWPPRIQVGRAIRIYVPDDRAQFLADGRVRTQFTKEAPAPAHDWRRWFQ